MYILTCPFSLKWPTQNGVRQLSERPRLLTDAEGAVSVAKKTQLADLIDFENMDKPKKRGKKGKR